MGTSKSLHHLFFLLFFIALSILQCLQSIGLPVQYSITGYGPEDLQSENRMAKLFELWRVKHGKVYHRSEEMLRRFENFKRNLKYIVERNSNQTGHMVGLNRFADLSNDEFREIYMSKVNRRVWDTGRKRKIRSSVSTCDAPVSLDWRKKGVVTEVKDQGSCGSCWAFSSTGAIEGINAINSGELISLSEQELVDCDKTDEGCDGGYMDYAFEWVINNGGIDTEADYPYTGVDGTCNAKKEAKKVVSIEEYEDVEESDSALLCATVNQPISVGIDGSSWDFQLYTGGIYEGDCSSNPNDIDHAVLIVGYASKGDKDYWIVKNSWGTSWGIQGYIYIRRNTDLQYGVCAINAEASYPTQTSASPSPYPSPTSPPPPPPPPYNPPPPPPPTPSPPPPPSPSPTDCGLFAYCPSTETCCCLDQFLGTCVVYGCCEYTNAVCCEGTEYCCPQDYPICDVDEGLCLKNSGDYLGIAAKKKTMAKHKLPFRNNEPTSHAMSDQPLQWRRNPFTAT